MKKYQGLLKNRFILLLCLMLFIYSFICTMVLLVRNICRANYNVGLLYDVGILCSVFIVISIAIKSDYKYDRIIFCLFGFGLACSFLRHLSFMGHEHELSCLMLYICCTIWLLSLIFSYFAIKNVLIQRHINNA